MTDSQQVATAVAARSIGAKVTERTVVSSVPEDSPAKGSLQGGDQITSIDGTPVSDGDDIRAAVQRHTAGDTLRMTVLRSGRTVEVATRVRESGGRPVIGILLGRTYSVPFDVKVDVGRVGGPSAGLMLSLGIRDVLTPGDLTGGKDIAGTGTMSPDGAVGPIGGIAQKVVGARADGADWFLAPADNCKDLAGRVPDGLSVVKVTTFEDALSSVEKIASGDSGSLPRC